MKKFNLSLLCILTTAALLAQKRPVHDAVRLSAVPYLDGELADSCWQVLAPLEAFSTLTPVFGQTPCARTEVRIFYTETALYVAAYCYDPDAKGIRDEINLRDGEPSGDWFQLSLDTWNDDQLAFDFIISAAGVQSDIRQGNTQWDAQWRSAVRRQSDGWSLEMCVPFTAFRFAPHKTEQNWGLQCTRFDRSTGETSTWSPQNPLVNDRVRQFGTLAGLMAIRQLKRNGLSLLSSATLDNSSNGFNSNHLQQNFAVDARFGLNASTTLDLTVLPPVGGWLDASNVFETYGDVQIPAPRQLEAEESDLFTPGAGFDLNPGVDSRLLLWRRPARTGETYTGFTTSPVLNAIKLCTRTNGNWRFVMSNTLLGPAKVESFYLPDPTSSFIENKKITLQSVSDYNYLTAQYLLPNNSFIAVSNTALLAGPDAHSFLPGLGFALRDKSNSWQLSGSGGLGLHKLGEIETSGAAFDVRVARINRSWGWALGQSHNQNRYFARVMPDPLNPDQGSSRTFGEISFRDFNPRGKFLNRGVFGGVAMSWAIRPFDHDRLQLYAGYSVLSRRFRRFSIDTGVEPLSLGVRYENGGKRINRRISGLVQGHASFVTDSRKRSIYTFEIGARRRFQGEDQWINVAASGAWFSGRRISVTAGLRLTANFQELFLQNNLNQWVFERRDTWYGTSSLQLNIFPVHRLLIFAAGHLNWLNYANRELVLLQDDGQLVHPEPLPSESSLYSDLDVGVQFFFSSISQLRYRYVIGPKQNAYGSFLERQRIRMNVDFVYVIGGEKAL